MVNIVFKRKHFYFVYKIQQNYDNAYLRFVEISSGVWRGASVFFAYYARSRNVI